ncbi:MAG: hypothetical protein ACRCYE_05970 [Sarcina sp.]
MKKNKINTIIATIVVLSAFNLTSCTNKTQNTLNKDNMSIKEYEKDKEESVGDEKAKQESITNETEKNSNTQSTEGTKSNENSSNESNLNDSKNNKENLTIENNNKDDEKLKYPTFENEKINKLIESYIKKISNLYDSLDINYKIMYQDNKFISIFFFGNVNAETSAYPSKFQSTLNINIESPKIVKLNEIININEAFIGKFKEALINKLISLGLNPSDVFDLDNLGELLQKSDNITEYLPEVQSYFTKNQLTIILNVPHAIGDYIEIVLK